ncbi:glycosyltransferase, partial [Vibrio parahaemolyticus]
MPKPTLAVALIVKNEEKHLQACLDTVKDWVDEIVILDSGSTDSTESIARQYTDK